MAVARVRRRVRTNLVSLTVVGTLLAYAAVIGTFAGLFPYPAITLETSTLLSHLVAIANLVTVCCLVIGWWAIRRDRVTLHRRSMLAATAAIVGFLVLYLVRVGGGGTKHFVGPDLVATLYVVMLAIHVLLSIVAVPLVIYALLLGVSHTPAALRRTNHARVGRVAAATWIVSLVLGLVTYLLLEHVFDWQYVI